MNLIQKGITFDQIVTKEAISIHCAVYQDDPYSGSGP